MARRYQSLSESEILECLKNGDDLCDAEFVCKYGYLEVAKYLYNLGDVFHLGEGMTAAIEYGQMNIVKWIFNNHPDFDEIDEEPALNWAAAFGQLEMLQYFASRNLYCSCEGANVAAGYGYLDVVKFLWETCNIQCTQDGIDFAQSAGHVHVVSYLQEKGLRCSEDKPLAAIHGHGRFSEITIDNNESIMLFEYL